jgi:TonB family protein
VEWWELHDPTLFASVSRRGFSGQAWLRLAAFPYLLTNQLQGQLWLDFPLNRLGSTPTSSAAAALTKDLVAIEKPAPELSRVEVDQRPFFLESGLRIDGDLAKWRLVTTNSLPAPDAEAVLGNCVLQLLVDSNGDVLSATVLDGSGSVATDERALTYARTAHFVAPTEPAPELTFGKLVFQWFAGRLPGTNGASNKRGSE